MHYPYVVILKRNSDRLIDWISILLCLSSAALFILVQWKELHFNYLLSAGAGLIFIRILFNLFSSRNTVSELAGRSRPLYRYLLMTAAIGWLGMPVFQWVSLLFVLLAFLEYQAKHPLGISFSPDKIVINSLFRKTFAWSDFSNILLKDGLLTLDFSNNRIIQREVDEEKDGDADEFNDYCREMLHAANLNEE